ncbi:hypothetical protein MNV49_003536 [Pseudohyphozyma bogoriensis]|nr:hypothetical protein MNV49_003536 [Pseudohyphozyma bogoriensis]
MSHFGIDKLLAPFTVGALLSTYLSGIVLSQVNKYYQRYPLGTDRTVFSILVAIVFVLDIFASITASYTVYHYAILWDGVLTANLKIPWSFAVNPTTVAIVTCLVQGFYGHRVYLISNKNVAIPGVIAVLSIIQLGFGIGGTKICFTYAADILITSSIVFYLTRAKSKSSYAHTSSILSKVMRNTIENNALTAAWAVTDCLIFATSPSLWHLMFNVVLPHLYILSFLVSLNARAAMPAPGSAAPVQTAAASKEMQETRSALAKMRERSMVRGNSYRSERGASRGRGDTNSVFGAISVTMTTERTSEDGEGELDSDWGKMKPRRAGSDGDSGDEERRDVVVELPTPSPTEEAQRRGEPDLDHVAPFRRQSLTAKQHSHASASLAPQTRQPRVHPTTHLCTMLATILLLPLIFGSKVVAEDTGCDMTPDSALMKCLGSFGDGTFASIPPAPAASSTTNVEQAAYLCQMYTNLANCWAQGLYCREWLPMITSADKLCALASIESSAVQTLNITATQTLTSLLSLPTLNGSSIANATQATEATTITTQTVVQTVSTDTATMAYATSAYPSVMQEASRVITSIWNDDSGTDIPSVTNDII